MIGGLHLRFTENSLFLGVDSLRLFEYLGHFGREPKSMVDIATYVAVHQDIRVALGLAENLFVAGFFSYDPADDYQRTLWRQFQMPRLRRPFYLTTVCGEFLADPYLKARSKNLQGPGWSVDEEFDEQPLPKFETIEISHPFTLTNARWLRGSIQTTTYMGKRIAPGLIHPSPEENEKDPRSRFYRHQELRRIRVLVNDPDEKRSWYVDDDDDGIEMGEAGLDEVDGDPEVQKTDMSRFDGVNLFGIEYEAGYYGRARCNLEVSRSFEEVEGTWRLNVGVVGEVGDRDLEPFDHTLLQSTITAVIGADLVRLAYLAGDAKPLPNIECLVSFQNGSTGGFRESFDALTRAESFWQPIPRKLRNLIKISVV
jgi:hypothetical protein